MRDLPFEPGSFDLLWSEGAAHIMGVSEALAAWRPLLRMGGYVRLPESDRWEEHYDPLEARLPAFERRYTEDEEGLAVVAATRQEIGMRRAHLEAYAYDMFVSRVRPGPA
jgi:hypothetical protein